MVCMVEIIEFRNSMNERAPDLARIALEYVSVPVNSVDAKRFLRVSKNLVSDRRRNLSGRNTAMPVEQYYNTCNMDLIQFVQIQKNENQMIFRPVMFSSLIYNLFYN